MLMNYDSTIALTGEQCRGEGSSLITCYSHRHVRANSTHTQLPSLETWIVYLLWDAFGSIKWEEFIVAQLIIKVLQLQDVITGQRQSQRSHFIPVKQKLTMPLGKSEFTFNFFLIKCFLSLTKVNAKRTSLVDVSVVGASMYDGRQDGQWDILFFISDIVVLSFPQIPILFWHCYRHANVIVVLPCCSCFTEKCYPIHGVSRCHKPRVCWYAIKLELKKKLMLISQSSDICSISLAYLLYLLKYCSYCG